MSKLASAMKHQDKIAKVMAEYKQGKLNSGSKSGPVVTSKDQAVAIAMDSAKRESGDNTNGEGHG